jgi:Family of unknown function (DUF6353)
VSIGGLINKGKHFVGENSTTILTSMGVSGVVTTAILTGRASFKAALIIDEETKKLKEKHPDDVADPRMNRDLSTTDKVKLVWPLYIPPVVAGASTITAIIAANQIASKRVAGLVMAQTLSEKTFQEYKEKVRERFGANKDRDIRDSMAQDRVNKNPVNSREVIFAGTGEVLCFDIATGRYFQSSVEEIKKAENKINYEILNHMYASLSQFHDYIGLPTTPYTESVGWNTNNLCEVSISGVMSNDKPCLAVDFHFPPIADYARLY